jgi:hypothetical protein
MTDAQQSRSEFLAERMTGIGGSDAVSLINEGYGCARRLWYGKVGFVADYPFEGNLATELGTLLEDFFLQQYEIKTGRSTAKVGVCRQPDRPYKMVHLDGLVFDGRIHKTVGALEVKALGDAMFRKTRREGLSVDYICQLQWGMMVGDSEKPFEWGSFAIGNRNTGDLAHWDALPDKTIQSELSARADEFWPKVTGARMSGPGKDTIESDIAPERLDPDDNRCRKCEYRLRCQGGAVMESIGGTNDDLPEMPELLPLYAAYKERNALAEEAESLVDEVKEKIKDALGEREAVRVGGRPIYFRRSAPEYWQPKELAKAYDALRVDTVEAWERFHKLFLISEVPNRFLPGYHYMFSAQEVAVMEERLEKVKAIKPAAGFKQARPQRSLRIY